MPHLLIVGGSDAGISAARRAREIDPAWEVTVLLADAYPNYSVCGLPFLLSGEVRDVDALAHSKDFAGIALACGRRAVAIDPSSRNVLHVGEGGGERRLSYDRLILATGARAVRPDIPGSDRPGVQLLRSTDDGLQLLAAARTARRAVVVGGGYIGIEAADALSRRGLQVTMISRSEAVLPTIDHRLGERVGAELRANGVRLIDGRSVTEIRADDPMVVVDSSGARHEADLVLLGVGVRPNADLATAAGCASGAGGAVQVDASMRTSLPGVWAAGDCATTRHRQLGDEVYLPLGSTAHKQGRIAGENALGGSIEFAGIVGTQVVKAFDLAAARTGVNDAEAASVGWAPLSVDGAFWDRNPYYPGAGRLDVRVTGDRATGLLLGAQIVGPADAEVAKRIDVYAAAIFAGLRVAQIADLDLSYSPPFASPWDATQQAAMAWDAARRRGGGVAIPVSR